MTASLVSGPTAFVSWAHGGDPWQDTVARFVVALRELGIAADVDLFHAHEAGIDWSTYGPSAIRAADAVLIATSSAYKQRWEEGRTTRSGAGAAREANVLKDLYDRTPMDFNKKVMAVVLPGASVDDIPAELASGLQRYVIPEISARHLEDLIRRLTGQPAYVPEPPGRVPILPRAIIEDTRLATSGTEEMLSSLGQHLARLDSSIASAADAGDDAGIDLKAERATVRAALEIIGDDRDASDAGPSPTRPVAPTRRRFRRVPSAVLVGCLMGRRRVYCGMMEVKTSGTIPPPTDVRVLRAGRGARVGFDERGSVILYDKLASSVLGAIGDLLGAQPAARIATIGIGTPGVIEVGTGRLMLSVTVPDGSDTPVELAERLIFQAPKMVERAFGVSATEPRELVARILVDNDVRCVARHYLCEHGWPNFACVYVGSGVGAGMVLDGAVYYGANGSAGHIGHIDLERSSRWQIDRTHTLCAVQCDCGILGFHFDPMANFSGLERIADALAPDALAGVLAQVRDIYIATGIAPEDYHREGFLRLLAFAHRRDRTRVPHQVLTLLHDRGDIDAYLKEVLNAYSTILASGIATLVEVIDPGTVILCGPVIDVLRANDGFSKSLRQMLPAQVFHHRSAPALIVEGEVREALWRGAALLPCERGFSHALDSDPATPAD